jgi:hypothetical protein
MASRSDNILASKYVVKILELVAVASWYLWLKRWRETTCEKIQDLKRSAQAIDAIYSNFYAANAPEVKVKRGG